MTIARGLLTLALLAAAGTIAPHAQAAVAAAPPAPGRYVYEGTIAGKRVLLRLRCGTACSGSYIYEDIGELLRLTSGGTTDFEETIGTGRRVRVTGHLAFASPPGSPPGKTWKGVWTSASTKAAQPIVLERVLSRRVPRAIKRRLRVQSPRDRGCFVEVRSFEISGLADLALEERVNDIFDPEHAAAARSVVFAANAAPADVAETCGENGKQCDESALGYRLLCRADDMRGGLYAKDVIRPTLLDAHLVSARNEYDWDGGGAHPSDGVTGITLDLRDGHALDARDLLRDPHHEPQWSSFVRHAPADEDGDVYPLALGTREGDSWQADAWSEFYLTPTAIALVPDVPEVARIYRHHVQLVPFARVRRALRPGGPAAQLYTH